MVGIASLQRIHWTKAWRIVATRQPRINLYGRIANSQEQRLLAHLEERTNPRMMVESGRQWFLRKGDYFRPSLSTSVKAPFSYLTKSRFGNGSFPVLYAAHEEATALSEKRYHMAEFFKAHYTPPTTSKQTAWWLNIAGTFHDMRDKTKFLREYSPTSYGASQALGLRLWKMDSPGIVYNSVWHIGGRCLAVFSPQTIHSCMRGLLYEFHWDGAHISNTFRLEPRQ